MRIGQSLNWATGTMGGAGRTVLASGAVMTISGSNAKYLSRVLEVQGTADYTGSNLTFGASENAPGTIRTATTGIFNAVGDGDFGVHWGGVHKIENEGTFIRSGAGTTTVSGGIAFNNSGVVEVQAGTLQVAECREYRELT